ncbi:hypothetical protein ACQ4PT_070874 [Festuca glaucescens]
MSSRGGGGGGGGRRGGHGRVESSGGQEGGRGRRGSGGGGGRGRGPAGEIAAERGGHGHASRGRAGEQGGRGGDGRGRGRGGHRDDAARGGRGGGGGRVQPSASQPAAVARVGVVGEHDVQHGGVGLPRPAGQVTAPAAEVLTAEVERKMVLPKADQRPPSSSATALVEEQRAGRESVVSSKAEKFPARPSFGTVGKRCRVRANHFLVQVANQDIHHYDVAIFPETRSRDRNRSIVNELVRLHRQYLDGRLPVYDGRKNIYTAGALPFKNKEFVVKLANAARGHQREEEYKVTIQHASKLDLYNLQQFLAGRHRELPQDTIQALDIALRESPAAEYLSISRSFFSQSFGHGGPIGNGVECWRGYYQSLRPTQLELSLNIDISATAFYKAQPVMDFAIEYLSMRDSSRLFDQDRLKIVNRNNYGNDCYSKEFGMKVTSQLALVDARVLPAPRLKYHESGRDKVCDPFVGQWNMINKSSFIDFIVFPQKFVNGGSVNYWACLTFASHLHPKDIGMFCNDLARMCNSIGMQMNMKPCVDITQPSRQDSVESAIRTIHRNSAQVLAQQGLAGKQLELLIIILPDVSGSYGKPVK